MKTAEFKERIEQLGLYVHDGNVPGDLLITTGRNKRYGDTVGSVSTTCRYRVSTDYWGFECLKNLENGSHIQYILYNLLRDYAETNVELR